MPAGKSLSSHNQRYGPRSRMLFAFIPVSTPILFTGIGFLVVSLVAFASLICRAFHVPISKVHGNMPATMVARLTISIPADMCVVVLSQRSSLSFSRETEAPITGWPFSPSPAPMLTTVLLSMNSLSAFFTSFSLMVPSGL